MSGNAKPRPDQAVIREATPADLESILRLDAQLYAYDGKFDKTLNPGWSRSPRGIEYFSSRIAGPACLVLVAGNGDELVGTLVGAVVEALEYRSISHVCELESMFVTENHRGNGLGAALVGRFIEWARAHCGGHVRVEVSAANRDAVRFYKKMGFDEYNLTLEARFGKDRP